MGRAMISKSLIQFSVDGRGCVPYSCLAWGQTMVGVMMVKGLLQKDLGLQCPWPCSRPLSTHASARDSWTLTGKSGAVSCGTLLLSPGSWCTQYFVCALQEFPSPVLWKFCNKIPLTSKVQFPGGSQSLCWIPRLGNLLCILELS